MRKQFASTYFALSALLSLMIIYAVPDRSHPTTIVKDSVITSKIKAKLAADHFSSLTQIEVDADTAGVVWLSGTAATQVEADSAVSIARLTEGVTSVGSQVVNYRDR